MLTNVATRRNLMVDRQISARGVRDPRLLAAMTAVPREAFLPPALAEFAYEDRPLPIGTGSGYAAAVLAVARRIYTIEGCVLAPAKRTVATAHLHVAVPELRPAIARGIRVARPARDRRPTRHAGWREPGATALPRDPHQ